MLKSKDELLRMGYKDEGYAGVSREIPGDFNSRIKIVINSQGNDVYFIKYGTDGTETYLNVDKGIKAISDSSKSVREAQKSCGLADKILKEVVFVL